MLNNIFAKNTKTDYSVEVTLITEDGLKDIYLKALKGREEETIEFLKKDFPIENVLKMKFIETKIRTVKNKEIKKVVSLKNYFIGKRLSMSELDKYVKEEHRNYANMFDIDEYQIGAVLHPVSGIVSPLYSTNKVIELELEKTISR